MSPVYRLYGVNVQTSLPLPGVPAVDHIPDLRVRFSQVAMARTERPLARRWRQSRRGTVLSFTLSRDRLALAFEPSGDSLTIFSTRTEPSLLADVFLGPGIATALHLKRHRMLHASAVRIGDKAAVLVGASGAGKSTLTAALVASGAALISEEITVVDSIDGRWAARPGYPRIGLLRPIVEALGLPPDSPRMLAGFTAEDKRHVDVVQLGGGFCTSNVPVGAVYVLGGRLGGAATTTTDRIQPSRAVTVLMQHRYGSTWLPCRAEEDFAWSVEFARAVPLFQLQLTAGLQHLTTAARAVIEDLNQHD
jgi:hypothetical protein